MGVMRCQPPGNGAATTPQATSGTITGMETMLSIWAHPDDETFLAAGIMAAAVRGDRVVCVSATAGAAAHRSRGVAPRTPRRACRRRAGAMAVLGDRAPHPAIPTASPAIDHEAGWRAWPR